MTFGSNKISIIKRGLKPLAGLLLKLILLLVLIKCIFFIYNASVGNGWQIADLNNSFTIIFWSFYYDFLMVVLLILLPVILFLFFKKTDIVTKIISLLFSIPLAFLFFINLADVFYYPYKLQRSDVELLYVLRNPFENITNNYFLSFR